MLRGAGRGLGTDIAKAALAAGHAVVATGRDAAKVAAAVGTHSDLLTIKLDVTRPPDAQAAVDAAVATFGQIDVLVNNRIADARDETLTPRGIAAAGSKPASRARALGEPQLLSAP